MPDTPETDDENSKLFRDTIGTVHRIQSDTVPSRPSKPRPVPFKSLEDERKVISELLDGDIDPSTLETGEELLFRRQGIQNKTFRKLRNGSYRIEAHIDLHGMTAATAKESLTLFLHECKNKNRRCAKIIHGKGYRSKGGKPVIKNKVNLWLRQRKDILAFCSARPDDGGTGAIYVLIKR